MPTQTNSLIDAITTAVNNTLSAPGGLQAFKDTSLFMSNDKPNYSWTDSELGRTFWIFDPNTQEWKKDKFISWEKLPKKKDLK